MTVMIIKNTVQIFKDGSGNFRQTDYRRTGSEYCRPSSKALLDANSAGGIFEIGAAGDVPSGPTPPATDNSVGDLFWDTSTAP